MADSQSSFQKIVLLNLIFGACDALTGILLIFWPSFILSIMQITEIPKDLVFLRYIGAFVFSTGLSYFLPFIVYFESTQFRLFTTHVWYLTSLTRFVVASFVISQIFYKELSFPWVIVVLTDFNLAFLQLYLIRKWRMP